MRFGRSPLAMGLAALLALLPGGCNTQTEIPLAKVPPPPPGFGQPGKAAPGTKAGSPANAMDLIK